MTQVAVSTPVKLEEPDLCRYCQVWPVEVSSESACRMCWALALATTRGLVRIEREAAGRLYRSELERHLEELTVAA